MQSLEGKTAIVTGGGGGIGGATCGRFAAAGARLSAGSFRDVFKPFTKT